MQTRQQQIWMAITGAAGASAVAMGAWAAHGLATHVPVEAVATVHLAVQYQLWHALALGMGWPMLLLGTLGPRWLPKRGIWMHRVKVCFGFVLLAAPLLLLGRWVPEWLIRSGWSLLITTAVGYLLLTLPISLIGRVLERRFHFAT